MTSSISKLNEQLTLEDAIGQYHASLEGMVSDATLKTYRNAARHLVGFMGKDYPLVSITKMDMTNWRTALLGTKRFEGHPVIKNEMGKLAVHTVRRILSTMTFFFNWAVEMEFLSQSPLRGVKMPPVPPAPPKAIAMSDFEQMLKAAAEWTGNRKELSDSYQKRNVAIIHFLASTGCRVAGLCGAKLSSLTFDSDGGCVEVSEKGRGGLKSRMVYLSATSAQALKDWLSVRPLCDVQNIFVGIDGRGRGKPLTEQAVRQTFNRLAKRIDQTGRINPHSFRHACAREWLNRGADLATVSQLLGHADIHVTARHYARWTGNELQSKHKKLSWT